MRRDPDRLRHDECSLAARGAEWRLAQRIVA